MIASASLTALERCGGEGTRVAVAFVDAEGKEAPTLRGNAAHPIGARGVSAVVAQIPPSAVAMRTWVESQGEASRSGAGRRSSFTRPSCSSVPSTKETPPKGALFQGAGPEDVTVVGGTFTNPGDRRGRLFSLEGERRLERSKKTSFGAGAALTGVARTQACTTVGGASLEVHDLTFEDLRIQDTIEEAIDVFNASGYGGCPAGFEPAKVRNVRLMNITFDWSPCEPHPMTGEVRTPIRVLRDDIQGSVLEHVRVRDARFSDGTRAGVEVTRAENVTCDGAACQPRACPAP